MTRMMAVLRLVPSKSTTSAAGLVMNISTAIRALFERKIVETIERLGEGSGPLFGTVVHKELADWVRNSGIPGLSAEESWLDGLPALGNLLGSKRPDIVLRETNGEVLAVWDWKTGGARVTEPRAAEIRRSMNIGPEEPIIGIGIGHGTEIKISSATSEVTS